LNLGDVIMATSEHAHISHHSSNSDSQPEFQGTHWTLMTDCRPGADSLVLPIESS
jgi:hypothetical protein